MYPLKRNHLFAALLFWLLSLVLCLNASAQTVFNYTGAIQTYTVPAGVTSVLVDVKGAQGGSIVPGSSPGGLGGRVQATLAVTPGDTLNIYVGGAGCVNCATGFNGGGTGRFGGGGNASDIRVGGTALSNRVVVAGGGGGLGNGGGGGLGGGTTGGSAIGGDSPVATGGTQSAGGSAGDGWGTSGSAGTQGVGGAGHFGNGGGGGGGGYYGGGGGSVGGGGGGSSFADGTVATNPTHSQGYQSGDGSVTISIPYDVTFDANGGTGTMTVQSASVATALTGNAFSKTGYTFAGWNTVAGGGGTAYANAASYPFTSSTTLYAQWTINQYTVTFDANTGTGTMAAQSATYNVATALTSNAFTKVGYTFAGWNTVAAGGGTAYANNASYPFTASTTLYAQWTINQYTVTFDANLGTGTMAAQSANYNVATALTGNAFTKVGYTFAGWNTVAGGGGSAYANNASYPFTASTTLYAQWTINQYTVTFNANTGTGTMAAQSANYNVATALTSNSFAKVGYTFAGWNTVAGGGGAAYANNGNYPFTSSTTLYAQWTLSPINGICGVVAATAFVPTNGLCTQGTAPGSATPGSPWTWSCTGSGGGTTASCSAPNASTATGTGSGRAGISGGTWVVDTANSGGFVATSTTPSLPPGYTFPHGLFDLKLIAGGLGSSASVVLTYPSALPAGTVYWKYGKTPTNATTAWYQFPGAVISSDRLSVTLTLTDGALGDDDATANSVITDPGGPGAPAANADAAVGIPTLSEWGLILLTSLMVIFGMVQVRRRSPVA